MELNEVTKSKAYEELNTEEQTALDKGTDEAMVLGSMLMQALQTLTNSPAKAMTAATYLVTQCAAMGAKSEDSFNRILDRSIETFQNTDVRRGIWKAYGKGGDAVRETDGGGDRPKEG